MEIDLQSYVGIEDSFLVFFEQHNLPMSIYDVDLKLPIAHNEEYKRQSSMYDEILARYGDLNSIPNKQQFFYKEFLYQIITSRISDQLLLIQIIPILDSNTEEYLGKQLEKLEEEKIHSEIIADELSQKLETSEVKFKKIAKIAPVGILYTNRDFEVEWNNDKCKKLFNKDLAKNHLNFIDTIYVQDIAGFWSKINQLKNGDSINFDFEINRVNPEDTSYIKCSAIKSYFDDFENQGFVFILEDVTENTHYIEEISNQNLELSKVNHELDKFLYSISHNIRGPISSFEGLLNLLELKDQFKIKELQYYIKVNLRLLKSFVSDIDHVVVNSHSNLQIEEFELQPGIQTIIDFLEHTNELKSIVHYDIPEGYRIKTDVDRLSIILKNVLKNCFHYRDQNKDKLELKIGIKDSEDFSLLTIEDNGNGISDSVKPYIFNMFYRGSTLSQGNGMGLYNARQILKKIGGTINIESKERKGTLVKIYLPKDLK